MTDTPNKISFEDVVHVTKAKGPNSKGWYNGNCPAHDDQIASFGLKKRADGSFAVKCQAGCKYAAIVAALEQKTGKKYEGKIPANGSAAPRSNFTVQNYSDLKHLPVQHLTENGTIDILHNGKIAIGHTYIGEGFLSNGWKPAGIKLRRSADSHDTFWLNYKESVLYGWKHLASWMDRNGRFPHVVWICEGESDVQTLAYHNQVAFGVSGKNGWKPEYAESWVFKVASTIVIVHEPDADEFVQNVVASFPPEKLPTGVGRRIAIAKFPSEIKDPSALWITMHEANPAVDSTTYLNVLASYATIIFDSHSDTDTGNAERLVEQHGHDFRWVLERDALYVWNGAIWKPSDKTGDALLPHTKVVVEEIPSKKFRSASESAGKRRAMINMSKGEVDVLAGADIFNRHPMLLNVANGTLDLETQSLREFDRNDYLTKQSPVTYDPFATAPKFDAFLKLLFDGNEEVIHFILKALGYTLTGNISETAFFICCGVGGGGKTTLLELMAQILGRDYVYPAKFSTFVNTSKFDPKYELAEFESMRMVTSSEPRKSAELDEEVIKQVSGGDQISARNIYSRTIRYVPEFKLWLAMNNKPQIVGTDEGIWRRVRFIPFNVQVPEGQRIKDYHKVLFAEEGPGILNCLLDGIRDWMAEGLKMPKAIADVTSSFREVSDVFKQWLAACCVTGKNNLQARGGDLYDSYRKWMIDHDEHVIRTNEFYEELQHRGFQRSTAGGHTVNYLGIGLLEAPAAYDLH